MGLFQLSFLTSVDWSDSPGVTVELGEPGVIGVPGVVTVPGLPGVVGGTKHRIPGPGQWTVTGFTGFRCDRGMFRVHWSVDRRLLN